MTDLKTTSAISAALGVAKLRAVRTGLLPLHKALLDVELARYEQAHGKIEGPQKALQLVMKDAWFAWLKPLAALIVSVDERLAADAPIQAADVEAFREQTRALLRKGQEGDPFLAQYQRALQDSPDVVVEHGRLAALLSDGT